MSIPFILTPSGSPKTTAITVALILTPFMWVTFQVFNQWFGMPLGYLLSMLVYFSVWCTLVPLALLGGWSAYRGLFSPIPSLTSLGWKTNVLLWWPVIFPLLFKFIPSISQTTPLILAASLLMGILVGVSEEVLWRGVFIKLFPNNGWMNLVLPSVLFAVWHVAPLAILPNRLPGGVFSFVFYALVLGLSYGLAARRSGSIAWPTLAHILHDSLGLSGFMFAAWLVP
jgi:uncharacterized protein